jgi:threonine dehydrogenase-like Zn-dependent dehydrogenase
MAHNHTMKAARWEGKVASISVEDVPIPRLQDPLDAIVRLTSTTICGTDLHIFRGRFVTDPGYTLGHGAMGIITALGSAITTLKIGDHVVVTGVLERGTENGEESPAGYLGIGHFQGDPSPVVNGGQAEYLRVPFANVNVLGLLQGVGNQLDYLLLADIWPTAWFGLECAGQVLGDTVVCFGAGSLIVVPRGERICLMLNCRTCRITGRVLGSPPWCFESLCRGPSSFETCESKIYWCHSDQF